MIELIGNKIFLDDNCEIREYYTDNGNVLAFVMDGCIQSLMYKDKKTKLASKYFEYYDLPLKINPNGNKYLMLGGGVCAYAHYYLDKYTEKTIDIVESNSKCIEYAKKYFNLNELIDNYSDRINVIEDDALEYICNCSLKYDYLLIDLFDGSNPINNIYDKKYFDKLKSLLIDGGIVVINYIVKSESDMNYVNKITKLMNNNRLIIDNSYYDVVNSFGNVIIVLSNAKL